MREYQERFRSWTTETVSSFTYEYDLSGLIKKETSTQDGSTVERIYAYDDRCQIIAVNERVTTDCGKTWNVQDTYYTYDNAGNCIKEEVKRSSTTLYYTDYQYNAADQLTKKVLNVGSLKATTNYSYDKNGNLIKESNTYNMSYSAACKCIKAYASLTIFDGEKTYKYDNENRLIATYDNGTLVQAILYDGNGNRAYTLDREDATSDSSASSVYSLLSSFKKTDISYDKSIIKNELLKEYDIGVFASAKYELTGYVTDQTQEYSQVLMEYGATGKVTNVYSYAEGRVSAIIDARSYSYLNDGRGSVSELTMTSGSTAVSYRYDIYGKTLASNKCINNPYQYNAEYTDSTTGLQYLRARYYNSDTHRFQTKDTYQGNTAQPITRNNYAYANNNPVNFVDPSGHFFKQIFGFGSGVVNWAKEGVSGLVSGQGFSEFKTANYDAGYAKGAAAGEKLDSILSISPKEKDSNSNGSKSSTTAATTVPTNGYYGTITKNKENSLKAEENSRTEYCDGSVAHILKDVWDSGKNILKDVFNGTNSTVWDNILTLFGLGYDVLDKTSATENDILIHIDNVIGIGRYAYGYTDIKGEEYPNSVGDQRIDLYKYEVKQFSEDSEIKDVEAYIDHCLFAYDQLVVILKNDDLTFSFSDYTKDEFYSSSYYQTAIEQIGTWDSYYASLLRTDKAISVAKDKGNNAFLP